MHPTHLINRYLFYEFGFDIDQEGYLVDATLVTTTWPFDLHYVGTLSHAPLAQTVFSFEYAATPYYVLWGAEAQTYPCAGMTLRHLHDQTHGSAWMKQHDPITLATARIGDPTIPPTVLRRAAIELCIVQARRQLFRFRILEGLFLRNIRHHVALVEDELTRETLVVGTCLAAHVVGFPEAAAWRRLAVGVGKLVTSGHLAQT